MGLAVGTALASAQAKQLGEAATGHSGTWVERAAAGGINKSLHRKFRSHLREFGFILRAMDRKWTTGKLARG